MRITGGEWRGRKLHAPGGKDVRPATDQVRQAIFNILLTYKLPADALVLDVFCGSGSYGFEALSRGASHCIFIDQSTDSCLYNAENINCNDLLTIKKHKIPKIGLPDRSSNLVFIDPPYDKNLVIPTLKELSNNNWLEDGAICIVESEQTSFEFPDNYELLDQRDYGRSLISILRYHAAVI